MKRNDIGDSYVLGCSSGSLRRGECIHPRGRSRRLCWQALHTTAAGQPGSTHRKAMPIRQPLEMPGRYCFHSTRPTPWEASQCGVERRPPVQERSELQAHETTMLQCLAVEVRKGLGRSPGPCRTSSASFPGYPTQVRDGRRALCRGAAFDLRCRSCQATSSITSSLPLNEIASPASRPSLASRVQAALAGL